MNLNGFFATVQLLEVCAVENADNARNLRSQQLWTRTAERKHQMINQVLNRPISLLYPLVLESYGIALNSCAENTEARWNKTKKFYDQGGTFRQIAWFGAGTSSFALKEELLGTGFMGTALGVLRLMDVLSQRPDLAINLAICLKNRRRKDKKNITCERKQRNRFRSNGMCTMPPGWPITARWWQVLTWASAARSEVHTVHGCFNSFQGLPLGVLIFFECRPRVLSQVDAKRSRIIAETLI